MTGERRLRCARCGDVIGIYEPLIVVSGDRVRETSLAAEPELPLAGAEHYHRACYAGSPPARHDDEQAAVVPIKARSREEGERAPRGGARRRNSRRLAG